MFAILKYLVISPGVLFSKGCKCGHTYDRSYDRPFHHGSYSRNMSLIRMSWI